MQKPFGKQLFANSISYPQKARKQKSKFSRSCAPNVKKFIKNKIISKYGSTINSKRKKGPKRKCYNRSIANSSLTPSMPKSKSKKSTPPPFKSQLYCKRENVCITYTAYVSNKEQKPIMTDNQNVLPVKIASKESSAIEVIELDSDNESCGSDVVVLPSTPPSVVALSDSDDESKKETENCVDSATHYKNVVPSICVSHQQSPKQLTTETLSYCSTSYSMVSSDDHNRTHSSNCNVDETQAQQNTEVVDNVTSNILTNDDNRKCKEKQQLKLSCIEYNSSEHYNKQPVVDICDADDTMENKKCKKRAMCILLGGNHHPTIVSKNNNNDYEQTLNESYCHGLSKSNKKFRSSYDENNESAKTLSAYISRGPAVDHCKSTKNKNLSISNVKLTISKKPKYLKLGTVTDNEFINTLTNLSNTHNTLHGFSDESDADGSPSARDIAERLLTKNSYIASNKKTGNQKHMNKEVHNRNVEFETYEINSVDQFPVNRRAETLTDGKPFSQSNSTQANAIVLHRIEPNIPQSPIHYVVYAYYRHLRGGFGWNDEMRNFYNETWNGQNFILAKVLKKMDPDKHLWKIYNEDRFNKPTGRVRNFRCSNCCEFGHVGSKCKRPKKPLICYMCGGSGHFELHCPNTVCLRCGSKTRTFTRDCRACIFQNQFLCVNCKILGHSAHNCPDNWRRYHSTIEPNAYPSVTIFYNMITNCCVCGARDHLSENCQIARRFAEYPIIFSDIKSHQKSYDDISVKSSYQSCISFNLLYEPTENYKFKFSENISHEKCYGRFLQAVGMASKWVRNTCRLRDDLPRSTLKHDKERSQCESVTDVNQRAYDEISNVTLPKLEDQITNTISVDKLTNPIHNDEISNDSNLNLISTISNYSNEMVPKYRSCCVKDDVSTDTTTTPIQFVRNTKPFQSGTLPDYIPLTINKNKDFRNCPSISRNNVGSVNVGSIVVATLNDQTDKSSNEELTSVAHLSSEAKIYLLRSHIKYLLSPAGQSFLSKVSQTYGIKARLEWTTVGHVLFISGSQIDQEKFHKKLLAKCNDLSESRKAQQSPNIQNVPKRTQVLIRFLKENIKELFSNLGDVNNLYKRLKYLEKQQSKCSIKAADKTRRALNMILFGKAGLLGGDTHLDKLLYCLKTLIKEYREDVEVPSELRNEIIKHWKVIFTSHHRGSYDAIIQKYNKLISKNRLATLNLDPLFFTIK